MKNRPVSVIQSLYVVITTIIVYALIALIFFEMDNAYEEKGATLLLMIMLRQ